MALVATFQTTKIGRARVRPLGCSDMGCGISSGCGLSGTMQIEGGGHSGSGLVGSRSSSADFGDNLTFQLAEQFLLSFS